MYNILKNIISSQRFELSSMLNKIDVIWLQNDITDDQRQELINFAREKADPSVGLNLSNQLQKIIILVNNLEKRVAALESKNPEIPSVPQDNFPEFELHHPYINGDKITFEGKKYICTLPEHTLTTTWSPKDYPPYWTEQK